MSDTTAMSTTATTTTTATQQQQQQQQQHGAPPSTTTTIQLQHPDHAADDDYDYDGDDNDSLARLPAPEALRLVSANLERLVRLTGDVPPTPPPRTPTDPQMTGLQAEKDMMARHTPLSPSPLPPPPQPQTQPQPTPSSSSSSSSSSIRAYSAAMTQHTQRQASVDAARLDEDRPSSPPSSSSPDDDAGGVGGTSAEAAAAAAAATPNSQHGAITRKFYSKLEPPISITGYLARLHQFCPASAAVYLAASVYIHRLAVEQAAVAVTRRNVHRLALAGLRVAAKALEDLAYPHAKVARVGGVSESELARLEISFCFLAGFDLVVGKVALRHHWDELTRASAAADLAGRRDGGEEEEMEGGGRAPTAGVAAAAAAAAAGIPTPPEGSC